MMNNYLVPANSKRGNLILNLFRPVDLIILIVGITTSLISLMTVSGNDTISVLMACIPVSIGGLLVLPIPNYHNVLCAMQSMINFFTNRRNYIWKGWCFYEKFKEEK